MEGWEKLQTECLSCRNCALAQTRTNVVFGMGNRRSPVLFIGEAPGATEDETGLPFTGRAGKLLDSMLASVGMDRSEIYIANTIKCRPPKNRDPFPEEQSACLPWLQAELELLKPKMIVCLGRISAMRFIKPDFRITQEHGVWFERDGRMIMAIYHPAALLRDPSKRGDAFEDLRKVEIEIEKMKASGEYAAQ